MPPWRLGLRDRDKDAGGLQAEPRDAPPGGRASGSSSGLPPRLGLLPSDRESRSEFPEPSAAFPASPRRAQPMLTPRDFPGARGVPRAFNFDRQTP